MHGACACGDLSLEGLGWGTGSAAEDQRGLRRTLPLFSLLLVYHKLQESQAGTYIYIYMLAVPVVLGAFKLFRSMACSPSALGLLFHALHLGCGSALGMLFHLLHVWMCQPLTAHTMWLEWTTSGNTAIDCCCSGSGR